MKPLVQTLRRGFTLVELSLVMILGMLTGAMVLALFNQQLVFLKFYQEQGFLTSEAPMISMYVSRLVGKADRFRLHDSVADALAGLRPRFPTAPSSTSPPVVLLNFRQLDGTPRSSILSFENRGAGLALYYYIVPPNGVVLGEPQWAITNKPKNVQFYVEQGVLRMRLTGPQEEQITYSGTMQQ